MKLINIRYFQASRCLIYVNDRLNKVYRGNVCRNAYVERIQSVPCTANNFTSFYEPKLLSLCQGKKIPQTASGELETML